MCGEIQLYCMNMGVGECKNAFPFTIIHEYCLDFPSNDPNINVRLLANEQNHRTQYNATILHAHMDAHICKRFQLLFNRLFSI